MDTDASHNIIDNEINEIVIDIENIQQTIQFVPIDDDEGQSRKFDENIQFQYINGDSPITISGKSGCNDNLSDYDDNSRSNSRGSHSSYSDCSDDEEIRLIRNDRIKNQIEYRSDGSQTKQFKKKNFHDVEKSLEKYYEYNNKYSSKIDTLVTYMKGQKNIFMQAKFITQRKIHLLMIPVLVFSSAMAIFAPIIQRFEWSGGLISALNIIITTFVTMLNYMKYESHSEKYLQMANQYDKLEMSLEMTTSKLLYIENDTEKNETVLNKLKEVEINMNELKEVYNILVPEEVIRMFPIVCHINIFSVIKKMDIHKNILIHRFKDVKNEIRYILYKWKRSESSLIESDEQKKEKRRLLFLYEVKEKVKNELLESQNVYDYIDELFTKEIKDNEHRKCAWVCFTKQDRFSIKKESVHPILQKYFQFIFDE